MTAEDVHSGWTRRVPHTKQPCSNEANHTLQPSGYLPWNAWASRKAQHYQQIRCPHCTLFAVWVHKRSRVPMTDAEAVA